MTRPSVANRSRLSPFHSGWRTLLLAGLAMGVNWYAPVIFGTHTLVLGVVLYWIAMLRIGPMPALFVLAAGTLVLVIKWGQPYSASLIALEGLMVGWAWRRPSSPLLAEIFFWSCIGTPASWIIYSYVSVIPHPSFWEALILQPVNGILAVLATFFLLEVMPNIDAQEHRAPAQNFLTFLLKRYLAFGTFPVIVGGFLVARSYERHTRIEVGNSLTYSARNLAVALDQRLAGGLATVREMAARQTDQEWFTDSPRLAKELSVTRAANDIFVTMLAAEASGQVLVTASRTISGAILVAPNLSRVTDREYFSVPITTGNAHISGIFRGRGLGSDLLIAVSAPVISHGGERLGVIEGSMLAGDLAAIAHPRLEEGQLLVLLCDRQQRVIVADGFDFPPLTSLAGTPLGRFIKESTPKPVRFALDEAKVKRTYLTSTIPVPLTDWSLTVMRPWEDVMHPVLIAYAWISAIALVTAIVAFFFAKLSMRSFLEFWGNLMAFSRTPTAHTNLLNRANLGKLPVEFGALVENLSAMALRLESERGKRELLLSELESRVNDRTKELEKALVLAKIADRAKSAFLATVTHELRTPLTSIITGISLLKFGGAKWAERETKTLGNLEKSSKALMTVISEVLDYSKLEADGVVFHPATFRPAELVADVISILSPAAKLANLVLRETAGHPPDLEWIEDVEHLRQILLNLGSNAIKFTGSGFVEIASDIEPSLLGRPRRLYFSVTDSGPGIPPDRQDSIFKPFVQLETNRVMAQSGTGLGLTICRKLVEKMGGEISVRSSLGKGSRFEFWIPEKTMVQNPVTGPINICKDPDEFA